jgi:iron complex outermembrane receptor protein
VSTDSVFAEQIEVIRGPASVLYGGAAIGGVVNVVSGRLPREAMEGVHGRLSSRFDSATRGWVGGVQVDGGNGNVAWNAQISGQRAGDVRVPGAVLLEAPGVARGRVPGSSSDSNDGSLGVSLTGDRGYLGFAVSRTERDYGVPTLHLAEGERPTRIDLQRNRYETAGEWRPGGALERIRFSASHVDYGHNEIENADGMRAVATRFASRGNEGRLEVTLADVLGWRTALGSSANRRALSTRGEEGLLNAAGVVDATGLGVFAAAERDVGPVHVELGGRVDRESRDPDLGRRRDFTPTTVSAAAQWGFAPGYGIGLTLSRAQRAPGIEELYSNGAHHATGTFDVGDSALGLETARNVELSLRKTEGLLRWRASVYRTRFDGFVYGALGAFGGVDAAGMGVDPGTGEFTLQNFRQDNATFRGFELDGSYQISEHWTLGAFADRTIARIDGYGPAPRIPPLRIGGSIGWADAGWAADARLTWADRVDRLAVNETPTGGYTRLDAGLSYRTKVAGHPAKFMLRGINLLDEDIRLHTSYLKDGYPLAGRSVVLGATIDF